MQAGHERPRERGGGSLHTVPPPHSPHTRPCTPHHRPHQLAPLSVPPHLGQLAVGAADRWLGRSEPAATPAATPQPTRLPTGAQLARLCNTYKQAHSAAHLVLYIVVTCTWYENALLLLALMLLVRRGLLHGSTLASLATLHELPAPASPAPQSHVQRAKNPDARQHKADLDVA